MIPNLTDLALHVPNFIPEETCNILINFYDDQPKNKIFRERSYDENVHDNIERSGQCLRVEREDIIFETIHTLTGQTIKMWIDHVKNLGIFSSTVLSNHIANSHMYRFIKYESGDRIHDHCDAGWTHDDILPSVIRGSCTLNLSAKEDYEGGEFQLFRGACNVKLGKGDVIIFPADAFWVHGTKEVTSGKRYCINSFLHPDISIYENT